MREKRLLIQVLFGDSNYKELGEYSSYVSNLFTFNLPPVLIKFTQKLVIELVSEHDAFFLFPERKGESIYTVRETFAFNRFIGSDLDKLALLVEKVVSPLVKLYEHIGLNPSDVLSGHESIVKSNFKLKIDLLKKNNRNGVTATVTVEYCLSFTMVLVGFFNKNGLLMSTVDLFKTLPHHLFYSQLIHSAKWINGGTFQLLNKSKEVIININPTGEVSVDFYPIGRDIEGLKEEIRYFSLEQMFDLDAGKNCNMKILK